MSLRKLKRSAEKLKRKQEKKAAKRGGEYIAPTDYRRGQRATVLEILNEGDTLGKLIEAGASATTFGGNLADKLLEITPENEFKAACKKGCSYCCWQAVDLSGVEAFFLLDHLLNTKSPEELAQIRASAQDYKQITEPLNHTERPALIRRPCALLKDHICTAYEARPLSCRAFVSNNVAECKQIPDPTKNADNSSVTIHAAIDDVLGELLFGTFDALEYQGLSPVARLENVLAVIPDTPGGLELLASRYLAGEQIFD